ncbi:MAG: uracil-DNA glycosylase family protein [Anaplasma ovis]
MTDKEKDAVAGSGELLEVLKFYHENGVDCVLEEDGPGAHAPPAAALQGQEECTLQADGPSGQVVDAGESQFSTDWVATAKGLADKCGTLAELREAVESFEGCEIKKAAMNTVFSDGNPNAKIMLIGEAPGSNEDREGRPFCGASGMLLDKMLAAIGLDRKSTYISNTTFWRPPGNRRPTDFELEICKPFVEKHIALIAPGILVLVGSTACCSLLSTPESISRLRGRFHEYTNPFLTHPIKTAVIFHPAYLLRQPMQKRLAWEDLKMIRSYIEHEKITVDV